MTTIHNFPFVEIIRPILDAPGIEEHLETVFTQDADLSDLGSRYIDYRTRLSKLFDDNCHANYVAPVLNIAMEHFQFAPASRNNHHGKAGGLIVHTYEVVFNFLSALKSEGLLTPPGPEYNSEEVRNQAIAILTIMAVLHDWEKIACCEIFLASKENPREWVHKYRTNRDYISMFRYAETNKRFGHIKKFAFSKIIYGGGSHEIDTHEALVAFLKAPTHQELLSENIRPYDPQKRLGIRKEVLGIFTTDPKFKDYRKKITKYLAEADAKSANESDVRSRDVQCQRYETIFILAYEKHGKTLPGMELRDFQPFLPEHGASMFVEAMSEELETYGMNTTMEGFLNNFPHLMLTRAPFIYGRQEDKDGERGVFPCWDAINSRCTYLYERYNNEALAPSGDQNTEESETSQKSDTSNSKTDSLDDDAERDINDGLVDIDTTHDNEQILDSESPPPLDFASTLSEASASDFTQSILTALRQIHPDTIVHVSDEGDGTAFINENVFGVIFHQQNCTLDDLEQANGDHSSFWRLRSSPKGMLLSPDLVMWLKSEESNWRSWSIGQPVEDSDGEQDQ